MQGMTNEPKKLVVAVSGGIDSVALLHMLHGSGRELVVAHVNHGIRDDSDEDEAFVRSLAENYGLPFVATRLALGKDASEEQARTARYAWLERVREERGADAIATAHHQDDVLETMMINLLRGTGWRGLCSLRNTTRRYRPLLGMSKAEIVMYALDHDLQWHEDSTNKSFKYLRNRVRNLVVPRLKPQERVQLLKLYETQLQLREAIEAEITSLGEKYMPGGKINRHVLIMSDEPVAFELLRFWLGKPLERLRLHALLRFAKVARAGDKWSLDASRFVVASQHELIVSPPQD
jgi:tRNA(Ile)-lysidine synthase